MGSSLSCPITNLHIERSSSPFYRSGAITLNGWRNSNEDAHTVQVINPEHNIIQIAVYDGHGGSLASLYMHEQAPEKFSQITDLSDEDTITKLFLELDHSFLTETSHDDGTTACVVFVQAWDLVADKPIVGEIKKSLTFEDREKIGFKVVTANLGDSRAIIVNTHEEIDQNKPWFTKCTEDHKPEDPVERQRIVSAGGTVVNNRVDGNLALSRAIGDRTYKENRTLPPQQQKVIAVPDYESFMLKYGETLFVACDGISEAQCMDHRQVSQFVHTKIHELQNQVLSKIDPALDASKYAALPDGIKPYVDYLFDPALVSRHLIEQSLCFGSKDNHTAITVTFAPLPGAFEPTKEQMDVIIAKEIQRLSELPVHHIVPGPKHPIEFPQAGSSTTQSPDRTYTQTFEADLQSAGDITAELIQSIKIVDNAITNYLETNQQPKKTDPRHEMILLPIEWPETVDFPPIVVFPTMAPMYPPQLLQMLLQSASPHDSDF